MQDLGVLDISSDEETATVPTCASIPGANMEVMIQALKEFQQCFGCNFVFTNPLFNIISLGFRLSIIMFSWHGLNQVIWYDLNNAPLDWPRKQAAAESADLTTPPRTETSFLAILLGTWVQMWFPHECQFSINLRSVLSYIGLFSESSFIKICLYTQVLEVLPGWLVHQVYQPWWCPNLCLWLWTKMQPYNFVRHPCY